MQTAQQTASPVDFAVYKGKMVNLTVKITDGGDTREETLQGRVIEGNDLGLIFKRRSARTQDLIEAADVLSIEAVETARLQSIGQKHLKPVVPASVRRHLVDFHGMRRSQVESMSLEEAMRLHQEIDHTDLGHDHSYEGPKTIATSDPDKDEILGKISQLRRTA